MYGALMPRKFAKVAVIGLLALCAGLRSQAAAAPRVSVPGIGGPKAGQAMVSGMVVDTSGAVLRGAAVELRSADGAVLKTAHADANGVFSFTGLAAGCYRLAVSKPAFETKEISVTISATAPPDPLCIVLAVRGLSTTIDVQGRADDLVGIAASAAQGTVSAVELEDRPILRSGEILETVPGSSSRNTPAAARPTNIFCAASISTTVRTLPSSSTTCR